MTLLDQVDAIMETIPVDDFLHMTLRIIRENVLYASNQELYRSQVQQALDDRLPDWLGVHGNPPVPDWKEAVDKIWRTKDANSEC